MSTKKLCMPELLAPARNLDIAMAAVNHGADAVYMSVGRLSARAEAGNTLMDLERAVRYAHRYYARVYLALNIIFRDDELEAVRKLVVAAYNVGCDAIIVQDMALLEMELPPIALFASTQCHINTPEKAEMLRRMGFRRAILARELSFKEIIKIARAVPELELETFVYGSLCASYSGQCYLSCHLTGRSANRGECAQPCRSTYDLIQADGRVLATNKHLLSMCDFNLSPYIRSLAEQGITSFKIEGRMKDISYVKNVVAYFRTAMDATFVGKKRASSGQVQLKFVPKLEQTFARKFTTFCYLSKGGSMATFRTAKSHGEYAGKIVFTHDLQFVVESPKDFVFCPGDGVWYLDRNENLRGSQVRYVKGRCITLERTHKVRRDESIYRNLNIALQRQLNSSDSSVRRIDAQIDFISTTKGTTLIATDEDGVQAKFFVDKIGLKAKDSNQYKKFIKINLHKSGGTLFAVSNVTMSFEQPRIFRLADLNEWRRTVIYLLEKKRLELYARIAPAPRMVDAMMPKDVDLDYRANVLNSLAKKCYERLGARSVAPAFELCPPPGAELMRGKYCILRELQYCRGVLTKRSEEPLFLVNNGYKLKVVFDCAQCEMVIYSCAE